MATWSGMTPAPRAARSSHGCRAFGSASTGKGGTSSLLLLTATKATEATKAHLPLIFHVNFSRFRLRLKVRPKVDAALVAGLGRAKLRLKLARQLKALDPSVAYVAFVVVRDQTSLGRPFVRSL